MIKISETCVYYFRFYSNVCCNKHEKNTQKRIENKKITFFENSKKIKNISNYLVEFEISNSLNLKSKIYQLKVADRLKGIFYYDSQKNMFFRILFYIKAIA